VFQIAGADAVTLGGGVRTASRLPVRIDLAGGVADGEQVVISDGAQLAVTFEFDTDGTLNLNTHQAVAVGADPAATAANLAAAIRTAVRDGRLTQLTAISAGTRVALAPQLSTLGNQADDEDGVRFDSVFVKGFATPITVTASGIGLLDGWIDWDRNGRFDASEEVIGSQPVYAGENRLFITTPASVDDTEIPFYTFARFRLSRSGGLAPEGLALGGEVEDYRIRVITNQAPSVNASLATATANLLGSLRPLEDQVAGTLSSDVERPPLFNDVDVTNGNGDVLTYTVSAAPFGWAVTDFGTAGAVHVRWDAVAAGTPVQVLITKSDHRDASGPTVTVTGQTLTIDLNTNVLNPTTARQLVDACNRDARVTALLTTTLLTSPMSPGGADLNLTLTDPTTYSPLTVAPSSVFLGETDFGTGGAVRIQFASPGDRGQVRLSWTAHDLGTSGPTVLVSASGINVDLNTNAPNRTTAQQVVDALQQSPAARALLDAYLVSGPADTIISGADPTTYSPVTWTVFGGPLDVHLDATQFVWDYLPNQNGKVAVVLSAQDQTFARVSDTVTVTLLPVNDPPSFVAGPNLTLDEDSGLQAYSAWATDLMPGPVTALDERIQRMDFRVSVTNLGTLHAADFAVPPVIDPLTGQLQFRVAPNVNGTAYVEVRLQDDGGTLNGGRDTSPVHTLTIQVTPINDAPTLNTTTGALTINEQATLTFDGPRQLRVADVDVAETAGGELQLSLAVSHGTLTLANTTNLRFDGGVSSGPRITLYGPVADVNRALADPAQGRYLQYTTIPDYFNGTDQLVITVNDQGYSGFGPATGLTDRRTLPITVRPVNNPPTIQLPAAWTTTALEDTNLPLSGLQVGDAKDEQYAPVTLQVTLQVAHGKVTVNSNVPGGLSAANVVGNGTSSVVLTASPATINTTLGAADGLFYRPDADYNDYHTDGNPDLDEALTISVNDRGNVGLGGALTTVQAIPLSVTPVNDPPKILSSGSQVLDEDQANFYLPIKVEDVDADETGVAAPLTVRLVLTDPAGVPIGTTAGTLTVTPGIPGGLLAGSIVPTGPTGSVTLTGSPGAISATLLDAQGLHFQPAANFNGNLALVATVEDYGNTGGGPNLTQTVTIPLSVRAVNDPPVVTVTTTGYTIAERLGASQTISGLSVDDVDAAATAPGYVVLTVQVPAGQGTLQVVTDAQDPSGTVVGVPASRISGNGSAVVTLTGTIAELQATLARNLTYTVPDGDFNSDRAGGDVLLTVTADDQGRTGSGSVHADTKSITVTVTPVNDPPVITVVSAVRAVDERAGAQLTVSGITVQDVDAGERSPTVSGDIVVTLSIPAGQGTVQVATNVTNGVPAAGILPANGSGEQIQLTGTPSQIDATLAAGVIYGVPDGDFNGTVVLAVVASDLGKTGSGGILTDRQEISLTVRPVNDAPTLAVPTLLQTIAEDASVTFGVVSGNALTVADVDVAETPTDPADATQGRLLVTLTASNGTLTLGSTANLVNLQGNQQSQVQFQADVAAVNAALDGLRFTPTRDFFGTATVVVTVGDQGNSGAGTTAVARGTLTVSVTSVNDAPDLQLAGDSNPPAPIVLTGALEDTPFAINTLTVSDPDAQDKLVVRLAVGQGTLRVSNTVPNGLTNTISGNGTGQLVLTGTSSAISQTLSQSLVYQGGAEFVGTTQLTVSADDQGFAGTGGRLTDQLTITLEVQPFNDPPRVTVPGGQTMSEDGVLAVTSLAVADPDAGAGDVRLTLSVPRGTLAVKKDVVGGLTSVQIDDSDPAAPVLTGPLAALNATLADPRGVTYTPLANDTGALILQVTANDLGNTGGAPQTASGQISITITAVNDSPGVTVPTAVQTVDEDLPLLFLNANGNLLSVQDLEAAALNADVRLQLSVGQGRLHVETGVANGVPAGDIQGNDSATLVLTGMPSEVNATLAVGLRYQGNPDYNGPDRLTATVSDLGNSGAGGVLTDRQQVTIQVLPVNDLPVAQPDTVAALEDVPQTIAAATLTANDLPGPPDEINQTLRLTAVTTSSPQHGTVVLSGGGVIYTPEANYNGADTFTYTIDDGDPNSTALGTVTVTISAVNDPPVANPDQAQTNEDTPLVLRDVDLLQNDLRGPAAPSGTQDNESAAIQSLILSGVSPASAAGGTVTLVNGVITYSPSADFNGTDTFTYRIIDTGLTNGRSDPQEATGTVTVTVVPVNDAPRIVAPTAVSVVEDTPTAIGNVQVADSDVNESASRQVQVQLTVGNGTLTVAPATPGGTTQPAATVLLEGTLAEVNGMLAATNGLIYTPSADFNGTDRLIVQVSDFGNTGRNPLNPNQASPPLTAQATVTLAVSAVNDAPQITAPALLTVNEDTPRALGTIVLDDADANTASVQLKVTLTAAHGSLQVATGLPNGVAAAQVTGNGSGQVTLTASLAALNVTLRDAAGVVYRGLPDYNSEDRSVTPPRMLPDLITISVNDLGNTGAPGPASASATVAITVTPVNDAPVANSDPTPGDPPFTVGKNTVLLVAGRGVLDNDLDVDGDRLSVSTYSAPSALGAAVVVNSDGTFRYDPTQVPALQRLSVGQSATDTFTYRATDGSQVSGLGTVTVTVTGLNDPPLAVNDAYQTTDTTVLDTAAALLPSVLANDSDRESDSFQVVVSASDAVSTLGAAVTLRANGHFVYDPTSTLALQALAPGQLLVDTFTYTIRDAGAVAARKGTVTVTVLGSNTNPAAGADSYTTAADTVLTVAAPGVLQNDADVEGQANSVAPQTLTSQLGATVELRADGSLTYDPTKSLQLRTLNVGQSAADTFTYQIVDSSGAVGIGTVTVLVTGIPQKPYQNPTLVSDVNADGFTSPVDALMVINYINSNGTGTIPAGTTPPPFIDVDGNGRCDATDVLLVINRLNEMASGPGGEGEACDGGSSAVVPGLSGLRVPAGAVPAALAGADALSSGRVRVADGSPAYSAALAAPDAPWVLGQESDARDPRRSRNGTLASVFDDVDALVADTKSLAGLGADLNSPNAWQDAADTFFSGLNT
jgi:VCBS repeat-containing protein